MSYTVELFPRRENWLQAYWPSGLFFSGSALFLSYSLEAAPDPVLLLFATGEALAGFLMSRFAYCRRNARWLAKPLISLSKDGVAIRDFFFARVDRFAWQDITYLEARGVKGRTILRISGRLEKARLESRLDLEIDAPSATEVNIAIERVDRGPPANPIVMRLRDRGASAAFRSFLFGSTEMPLTQRKKVLLIVALAPIASSLLMCGLVFGLSFLAGERFTRTQMIGGFAIGAFVFYIGQIQWWWNQRKR